MSIEFERSSEEERKKNGRFVGNPPQAINSVSNCSSVSGWMVNERNRNRAGFKMGIDGAPILDISNATTCI